jgi:integrase
MRLGEALALKWETIDFAGRFIDVRHTLTARRTLTTPKSRKIRRVDMSLLLTDTLKALLLERKKETLRRGDAP